MADIRVDITPENTDDRALVRRGHGTEPDIPRTTVSGLVDTDALLLRAKLVEFLGLRRRAARRAPGS